MTEHDEHMSEHDMSNAKNGELLDHEENTAEHAGTLSGHEESLAYDEFDEQLKSLAHGMREQMVPDDEVVQQTKEAVATLKDIEALGEQPLRPPVGAPLMLTAPTQASTATEQRKRRKRTRNMGIFAAAAAVVLVAVGGIALVNSTDNPVLTDPARLVATEVSTPASYEELFASLDEKVFSAYQDGGLIVEEAIPFLDSESSTAAPEASDRADSESGGATGTDAVAPLSAPEANATAAGAGQGDYSETNTQVSGVDEADIVKTDGKHIYSLYDNDIIITEALGKDTKELARISIQLGSTQDMYVSNERLVVMSSDAGFYYGYYGSDESHTYISLYDISDPAAPELLTIYGQDGSLRTSRLAEGTLYVASVYYVSYSNYTGDDPYTYVPRLYEGLSSEGYDSSEELQSSAELMNPGDIRILPEYTNAVYTVLTAIDVQDVARTGKLSVLGETSTVYMNQENLFLAATSYEPIEIMPRGFEGEEEQNIREQTSEVTLERLPIFPWEIIDFLLDPSDWYAHQSTSSSSSSWFTPTKVITRIARVELNDGEPELTASAVYDGNLLNQFSLDEYDGYLRVAMTVTNDVYYEDERGEVQWGGSETSNSLLVLDKNLTIVGSIEDLAPDERIYSARFTGEVGYMVTFRQTDPLFSLDLSDPRNPQVMDALKIPGFSEYLHPYKDGLLLGVGQDADNTGFTTGNLKLSMFDVSDPYAISEFDKLLIEAYYSPALDNHKAVLIDEAKNLIGFEIELQKVLERNDKVIDYQWMSCYAIYGYDDAEGFYERAIIELPDEYTESRALYIDGFLYIVNGEHIGIYDLETLEVITWLTL